MTDKQAQTQGYLRKRSRGQTRKKNRLSKRRHSDKKNRRTKRTKITKRNKRVQRVQRGGAASVEEDPYEELFKCPISGERMNEPVIDITNGMSYDRGSIESWLENHGTSPRSGHPLTKMQLLQNIALKKVINVMGEVVCPCKGGYSKSLPAESTATPLFLPVDHYKRLWKQWSKEAKQVYKTVKYTDLSIPIGKGKGKYTFSFDDLVPGRYEIKGRQWDGGPLKTHIVEFDSITVKTQKNDFFHFRLEKGKDLIVDIYFCASMEQVEERRYKLGWNINILEDGGIYIIESFTRIHS